MVTPRRREKAEFQRRCSQCRDADHTMASQSTLRLTHPHCRSCDILMGPGHMANYTADQCDQCAYLESRGITFGQEDE